MRGDLAVNQDTPIAWAEDTGEQNSVVPPFAAISSQPQIQRETLDHASQLRAGEKPQPEKGNSPVLTNPHGAGSAQRIKASSIIGDFSPKLVGGSVH